MPEKMTLLHPNEAALRLRVSPRTIRRYASRGLLTGVKVGPKLIKVSAESVDHLIASGVLNGGDDHAAP